MPSYGVDRQQRNVISRFWQAESRRAEVEHAAPEIRASKLKATTEEIEARKEQMASLQARVQRAIAQARALVELPQSDASVTDENATHPVLEYRRYVERAHAALQALEQSSHELDQWHAARRAAQGRFLNWSIVAVIFCLVAVVATAAIMRAQAIQAAATQIAATRVVATQQARAAHVATTTQQARATMLELTVTQRAVQAVQTATQLAQSTSQAKLASLQAAHMTETLTSSSTVCAPPMLDYCQYNGLPPRLTVGEEARVLQYPDIPNRLRAGCALDFGVIGSVEPGTVFLVLDGPVCRDDIFWWRIRLPNGHQGWTAEGAAGDYYVEPVG